MLSLALKTLQRICKKLNRTRDEQNEKGKKKEKKTADAERDECILMSEREKAGYIS